MNIKDPAVREMAQALARLRGVSMTEAVRQAVDEALTRARADREGYVDTLVRLAREVREASDEPFLTDDDLYDERGLPR